MARSGFKSQIRTWAAALMLGTALATAFVVAPAQAQAPATPPAAQPVAQAGSFAMAFDMLLTVHADRTAERFGTTRIKILSEAALQTVGQQMRGYVEGMQTLDIVEAYTEKADGRKIAVEPANIITRDGATGLMMMFLDIKVRTVIFPDLAVGDTIVLTTREREKSGVYPGHFNTAVHFPRTAPFAASTLRVVSPKNMGLRVAAEGEGLTSTTSEDSDTITRVITYRPSPMLIGEPGTTAAGDRDPRILISTFNGYQEMGRAYWAEAAPKAAITPEIAALAQEITKGIDDRRAQAEAIARWVKRNIRYVAVYLGTARVVPNTAASVLKNKYGDCKDHVTLLSALLAAKRIPSEQVLIQAGNAYTLPEPATMAYLNHVILYLPEFRLYEDPTGTNSGFGVLSGGTYDKPVIHMSANGVYLARTPAMRPEDHTVINRTKISIAADGKMTGTTSEIATGMFGAGLRSTAAGIRHNGLEASAERQLRTAGTPGTGRFDLGAPAELAEPYVVQSTFSIAQPAKLTPGGTASIPYGLGTRVRPGEYLLSSRFEGRTLPFVCFSGRMIEEIELTFADGLPMPRPFKPITIGNRWLTYATDHKIEGRTMKIRREFTSHVPGQVCGPEIEKDVGALLKQVSNSVRIRMSFAPLPKQEPPAAKSEPSPPPATGTKLEPVPVPETKPGTAASGGEPNRSSAAQAN